VNIQEMIKRLFLSIAISVAALIAGTSSAAGAVTRCDGDLPAGTYDHVLVPKGQICVLVGAVTVEGNMILQEGASLTQLSSGTLTVNGNLQGHGVRNVFTGAATITIHGNVSFTGATAAVALENVLIGGNLNISKSNENVILDVVGCQVTGNALLQNNALTFPAFFKIFSNTIFGNLVCNGNDPAPDLGSPDANTVGGQRIGQCASP
jgi:hypothetical protein